jgi:hypothetical protein
MYNFTFPIIDHITSSFESWRVYTEQVTSSANKPVLILISIERSVLSSGFSLCPFQVNAGLVTK